MRLVARVVEQLLRPPRHDLLAEADEGDDHVLQVHQQRAPAIERQHVDAERRLQRRVPIELVQHDVRHGVALQLDHHAHAVTVGLVARVRNALDALLVHELRHPLEQLRLVHLKRQFVNDDRFTILANFFDGRLRAHDNAAASAHERQPRRVTAQDLRTGRKVRPRHDIDQLLDPDLRIGDIGQTSVDDFAQIVRRNVRRHADGDARRPVDEQIRKPRRQNDRLVILIVVVRLEVDGIEVDVLKQRFRRLHHAHFGVPHGGRRIAVDRTEIALTVDQRHAHRELLRHAHQRVVHRLIAVRMVLTDHVADDARRLAIGFVARIARLVHRIEDAPMHGLQAVAHVGKRAAHDHAHRVIEIRTPHLVFDGDRMNFAAGLTFAGRRLIVF